MLPVKNFKLFRAASSLSVSFNTFSLKYYGSAKEVEMERERQKKVGKFVIHPHSVFRMCWDGANLVLLLVSLITIPMATTFFSDEITTDLRWIAFNFFMDVWFTLDILLNFRTGYIPKDDDDDSVVLEPKLIRNHYLKSWFVVDLISAFPFDYLLIGTTSINSASAAASRTVKLFRFAKVATCLRLLRFTRLVRYLHKWEQFVGMQFDFALAAMRVFNLVCFIILVGHWNGCLQFLVPMINNFPRNSWVVIDHLTNKSWTEQYSWCLFKAMSHMVSIGYGQFPPRNTMDLWMTMISMVSGAVCFALFVGHITALIQSMDSSEKHFKEKYTQVKEYVRYRHLPKELKKKIFKYYEHRFQGKMFDEPGILSELSAPLREEVINFNCRHLVSAVPFFQGAEPAFVTAVVQKLKFEVFQPDDVIIKEKTLGKKMYFLQQGIVEIRSTRTKKIKQLADGCYFGEICLLTDERRVASVIAISYCHTYSLHVNDFNLILGEFPRMRIVMEEVAARRLENLGHSNKKLQDRLKKADGLCETGLANAIVRHDRCSGNLVLRKSWSMMVETPRSLARSCEGDGNKKPIISRKFRTRLLSDRTEYKSADSWPGQSTLEETLKDESKSMEDMGKNKLCRSVTGLHPFSGLLKQGKSEKALGIVGRSITKKNEVCGERSPNFNCSPQIKDKITHCSSKQHSGQTNERATPTTYIEVIVQRPEKSIKTANDGHPPVSNTETDEDNLQPSLTSGRQKPETTGLLSAAETTKLLHHV